jgi:hypothetical protein
LTLARFFELGSQVEAGTASAAELGVFRSATRAIYGRLGELLAGLPRQEARELVAVLDRLEHVLDA